MATLVENAIRIKETFNDILTAIKSKGATPSDENDVSTYASAIDTIPAGTSGPLTTRRSYYAYFQQQSTSTALTKNLTYTYNLSSNIEVFLDVYASLFTNVHVTINVYMNGVSISPIDTKYFGTYIMKSYSFMLEKGTLKIEYIIPKGTSGYTTKSFGGYILWSETK